MGNRVTWLLPVKNGMPYLSQTLESLAAQTYQEWEIIAWDNGSTDDTLEELRRWIPSRLPGKIVTGQPLGIGASLALMVAQSQTEYCARIDADDVNLPERLEQQVAFLDSHPEIDLVGSMMYLIDGEGQRCGEYPLRPLVHDDIVNLLLQQCCIGHPTIMFRREAVIEAGNYQDYQPSEDYDLFLRMASNARLANMEANLIYYRVHEKSMSHQELAENKLVSGMNSHLARHARVLYGCSAEEALKLRRRQLRCAAGLFLRIAAHLSKTQGGSLLSRLKATSFIDSGRLLLHPKDYITRLFLSILDCRVSLLKHFGKIIHRVVRQRLSRSVSNAINTNN